jgi:hypothetical protein
MAREVLLNGSLAAPQGKETEKKTGVVSAARFGAL